MSLHRVTPCARVTLAPNPGPMTLDGTNSYVLAAAGAADVVVVDPGHDFTERSVAAQLAHLRG